MSTITAGNQEFQLNVENHAKNVFNGLKTEDL